MIPCVLCGSVPGSGDTCIFDYVLRCGCGFLHYHVTSGHWQAGFLEKDYPILVLHQPWHRGKLTDQVRLSWTGPVNRFRSPPSLDLALGFVVGSVLDS